jgi:hypothetical protein
MGIEYAGEIHVVVAAKDGVTEEWVAATTTKEAVVAVRLQTGPEWQIKLRALPLTKVQVRDLRLRPGEVRRLSGTS